jgi:alpha-tubulin suppressor-like RCC1 family protein
LGHTEDPRVPNLVKSLLGQPIIQVACGAHHTLALLDNGWLYSWGWNSHQQLGFASTGSDVCVNIPRRVEAIRGAQVVDIACGNTHSAAVIGIIEIVLEIVLNIVLEIVLEILWQR